MSNSRLLSILPSSLANSSGKILTISNTSIAWTNNYAYDVANSAYAVANSAYASANNVAPQIQPAFNKANTALSTANSAYAAANNASSGLLSSFLLMGA